MNVLMSCSKSTRRKVKVFRSPSGLLDYRRFLGTLDERQVSVLFFSCYLTFLNLDRIRNPLLLCLYRYYYFIIIITISIIIIIISSSILICFLIFIYLFIHLYFYLPVGTKYMMLGTKPRAFSSFVMVPIKSDRTQLIWRVGCI